MNYINVEKGCFCRRPNRFIAEVQLGDGIAVCHVKNTGRRQAQHGACDETIPLIRGLSGMSQSSERDAGNPMPGTRESF